MQTKSPVEEKPRVRQPLPKCERAAEATPKFSYHRLRKAVHAACVMVFSPCLSRT